MEARTETDRLLFAYTDSDFDTMVNKNMELAEEAFVLYGGTIEGGVWTV